MRIDQSGNLEVHGNTLSVEVITQPKWWADYVFDEDYQLPSLGEMEKYIEKHKHLPNSPSESEIMESGLNVSDMMARQQQTIEELALHTINQQKEIEALKKLVEMLYEKLHY